MLKIFSIINPWIVSFGMFVTATSCNTGSEVQEQENEKHSDAPISKVKIAEIESGIKTYIKTKEKQGDGFFHVRDKEKELRMKRIIRMFMYFLIIAFFVILYVIVKRVTERQNSPKKPTSAWVQNTPGTN